MKKLFLLTIGAFMSVSAYADEQFLSGYANACKATPQYQKFQKELCKPSIGKDGIEGCKMGKVSLPDSYTKLVESSTSKNNGDSTNFDIKLKPGITFAGNHVMAIEQWTGHSNGIWGSALVLEEKDINAVKKNIAQSGTKLKKSKSEMGENGAQILKGTDGKVRIVCDLSD